MNRLIVGGVFTWILVVSQAFPSDPRSPRESQGTIRTIPGFRVDLVACEPEIVDPVAFAFDASGRLYVVEMPGYPNGGRGTGSPKTAGRIKRLEDRDGDGFYETATTYVDGLRFPCSVMPWRNGVLVADAPNIYYCEDADGDGKAEIRRTLYTGFGQPNIQQMVNGLQFGIDGWVHGCNGANVSDVSSAEVKTPVLSLRSRHFRFHPDQPGSLEPMSGGGQFGIAADAVGDWFTCTNSEHLKHIVLQDRYLRNNPAVGPGSVVAAIPDHGEAAKLFRISPFEAWRVERTTRRAGGADAKRFPPTELIPGGYVTSACGLCIYLGGAFPKHYEGEVFVCDPANNLIHRDVLKRKGVTYVAERHDRDCEFLASTDNWFRPVFLGIGPDGGMYVADFYREVIETPLSLPEDIQRRFNLDSRGRGRIWKIVAADAPKKPAVRKLQGADDVQLADALAERNVWVRLTAQRLLYEKGKIGAAAATKLAKLAGDAIDPDGARHGLSALRTVGVLQPSTLVSALKAADARTREFALILSEPLAKADSTVQDAALALADDPSPRVRFQLACSLGGWSDPRIGAALASIVSKSDCDEWTEAAVVASSANCSLQIIDALKRSGSSSSLRANLLGKLTATLVSRDGRQAADLLRKEVARGWEPSTAPYLEILASGLRRRDSKSFAAMLKSAEFRRLAAQCESTARDEKGSTANRAAAMRILAVIDMDSLTKAATETLTPQSAVELQLATLKALSIARGANSAKVVLDSWSVLGPATRTEAQQVLIGSPDKATTLFDAIEAKRFSPGDLDSETRRLLLQHSNATIRKRAAQVLGAVPASDRTIVVQRYQTALTFSPNEAHGKALFQQHCATCHRLGETGPQVGPDLRAALPNKTKAALLIDILDPNREVDPRYVNYTVSLADGRLLSGIVSSETAAGVTIRRAGGVEDQIPRSEIERMKATGRSLMPEGFEKQLQPQDAADLIEFLTKAVRR